MRLDRFDLNLLVFLDGLLEERNVTRAGARLAIGQSAASAALARLRQHFGDPLLEPVGRRMVLTPLGRDLIAPVRSTVHAARQALALRPGFDPATATRRFRVVASDYAVAVLLEDVVRWMHLHAPAVSLEVCAPSAGSHDALEHGDVDLMILPGGHVRGSAHSSEALFKDHPVGVVWNGNDQVGAALDVDLLSSLGHVVVRVPGVDTAAMEEWCPAPLRHARRVELVVEQFCAVAPLIVGTSRVAILPARLAARQAGHLPVRVLTLPFAPPPVEACMQWQPVHDRDPAHVWLRAELRRCAAGLPSAPPQPVAPRARSAPGPRSGTAS